jgi:hypothetical protein
MRSVKDLPLNQYEEKGAIFISYALVKLSLYAAWVWLLEIRGKQINVLHISRLLEKHACVTLFKKC